MKQILRIATIAMIVVAACSEDHGNPLDVGPSAAKGGGGGSLGYTKTVIGTLSGDRSSEASAINASGEVVGGSVSRTGFERGFFYSGGSLQDLGPGSPIDLSDFGDVVGIDQSRHALVWQSGGGAWSSTSLPPYEVPVVSGVHNDWAMGIDRAGSMIVGQSSPDMGKRPDGTPIVCQVPVTWTPGSTWSDASIHLLPTADFGGACNGLGSGLALDVNATGQVVGISPTLSGPQRAVIWTGAPGSYLMENLPAPGAISSWAMAINGDGVIAGFVEGSSGGRVAVTWTPADGSWDVDTIGPDEALGLNDSGLVVGEVSEPRQEAWYRALDGTMRSLGEGAARDVNDANQAVGYDRSRKAVIWTITQP